MKLGYIDFLNCYPFYYHMFEKEPLTNVMIYPDYPGRLNKMIAEHEIDMSPVSAAAYAEIQDDVFVFPDFCLSSVGYVGSVTLISKIPIEDLNNKKVGVTNASHTSAVLLKIILKKYYNAAPIYITTGPRPDLKDIDAALLIGNDALVKKNEPVSYVYDLGDLWMRKTGFPVVFALFVVLTESLEKNREKIIEVVSSYHRSLACLEHEKDNLITKAKEKYPDIIYDIDNYYKLLRFEFTDDLKKALLYYYSAAKDMGLLRPVGELRFTAL